MEPTGGPAASQTGVPGLSRSRPARRSAPTRRRAWRGGSRWPPAQSQSPSPSAQSGRWQGGGAQSCRDTLSPHRPHLDGRHELLSGCLYGRPDDGEEGIRCVGPAPHARTHASRSREAPRCTRRLTQRAERRGTRWGAQQSSARRRPTGRSRSSPGSASRLAK